MAKETVGPLAFFQGLSGGEVGEIAKRAVDFTKQLDEQVIMLGSLYLTVKRYDLRDAECPVLKRCLLTDRLDHKPRDK